MPEPKISDEEFERLLEEMDEVGRQADKLHTRVNRLIDEMRIDPPAAESGDGDDET